MRDTRARCGAATLEAFGIDVEFGGMSLANAIVKVENAGYSWAVTGRGMTLAEAEASYTSGKYIIKTAGHLMALVDGELIDTALTDKGSIVEAIIEVR